jgi:ABC-type transport system involved in cytochrome c biogenesis permease subunit
MKFAGHWTACLLLPFLIVDAAPAADSDLTSYLREWTPQTVELARHLPLQEGGRIKPLETYAAFKLLKMNGKRSCLNLEENKLTPTEWLLDCLFFPELAVQYETFRVETYEVLDAIGLEHEGKKKRDWYSYRELVQGRQALYEKADEYRHIPAEDQTPVETQTVNLAQNLFEFEQLIQFLDFARHNYPIQEHEALEQMFADMSGAGLGTILEKAQELKDLYIQLRTTSEGGEPSAELAQVQQLLLDVESYGYAAAAMALIPPSIPAEDRTEWYSPRDLVNDSFEGEASLGTQLNLLTELEGLVQHREDPGEFERRLQGFHLGVQKLADARGEYSKISTEVFFYRCDFFYHSLTLYVLSFLLVAATWLRPKNRWLRLAIPFPLVGATLLLTAGIVLRCIIRSRPPVSTLYETILFITAIAVVAAMITEWINRQRIALAVATVMGSVGMFLANKYEIKEGVDTMPSLVAVLDTNFWLSTHVTTVVMGYAAGLLAAAVAHVYLLGKLFGFRKNDSAFYRIVARMTYGILCFGLLFATVGTILGGIWANDSWGRFWGWDPKENGALMIVLWQLFCLHGRMGGYLKDHLLCVAAVFGGIVVAFSWWGVNLLGVGLHSYGFTSGLKRTLMIFYGSQYLVMILGLVPLLLSSRGGPKGNIPSTP